MEEGEEEDDRLFQLLWVVAFDIEKEEEMRTQDEIDDVLEKLVPMITEGDTRWQGMTYEQGVDAALMWIIDNTYDDPYPDE